MEYYELITQTMAPGSDEAATRHTLRKGNLQIFFRSVGIYDFHDLQTSGDALAVHRLISP